MHLITNGILAAKKRYILISFVINALVLQLNSLVIPQLSMMERHEQWMARYSREYKNTSEKEECFRIFKANAKYIDSVNAAGKPYRLSLNQFADKTNDEFRETNMAYRTAFKAISATATTYANLSAIPNSIDWRKKGAVTPIRSETCGAWTFPAVDSVEGITKIKGGKLYTLSVQEIVDCNDTGDNNCFGGFVSVAFDFIKHHGLTTKSNYPPNDKPGTSDKKKEEEPITKISSYKNIPANNEAAVMKAVAEQPVAVSVDASGPDFQFYSSGVFTGHCGTTLDQAVTVVGYGAEKGKLKYWILKNSWGTTWGEEGYMKLQRNIKDKEGLCGFAMEAMYPVI